MESKNTVEPRRFSSLSRLYGTSASSVFAGSHVMVVGIGGVGSWVAEALARCGVGQLTLADLDHVAESNINRQVHALDSTIGMAKVQAMAQRIAEINPDCRVNTIDDFIDADNVLPMLERYPSQLILDCTDQVGAKIAMLLAARQHQIGFLMSGGAGGKTDVLSLKHSDLSQVRNDNLLARVRTQLRKQHGFARGSDAQGRALKKIPKMGVMCFWYDQAAQLPSAWQNQNGLHGLSCAGYGSSVTITASMGLAMVNQALAMLMAP